MPRSGGWNLLIDGPSHRLNGQGPVCFTREHQMSIINNIFSLLRQLLQKKPSSFLEGVSLAQLCKLNGERPTRLPGYYADFHLSPMFCMWCLIPAPVSLTNRAGLALLESKSWLLFSSKGGELKTSLFNQLSCFQSISHFYHQKFPTLPISKPFRKSVCGWVCH